MNTTTSTCTKYPDGTTVSDTGMTPEQIKEKLCYFDIRNPFFSITIENGYDVEDVAAAGAHAKKGCYCDNCFYGRTVLAEELLKLMAIIELDNKNKYYEQHIFHGVLRE